MGFSCGIDFGTTNSSVAVIRDGRPVVVDVDLSAPNPKIMRSLVYLNPEGEEVVGQKAIERYLWDINNIPATPPGIIETGRMIKVIKDAGYGGFGGVKWVPELVEIDTSGRGRLLQSLKSVLTNDLYKGTEAFGKEYSLEELLAILMRELKQNTEKVLEQSVDTAVIGRPVRYVGKHNERLALERMETVCKLAGFKSVEFEFEPVGAVLNYGLEVNTPQKVLVFDFGGGTLDVCVMSFPEKKVIGVSGRPIGGDLLSSELLKHKLLHYFGSKVTLGPQKIEMPYFLMNSLTNWYTIAQIKTKKNLETLDELRVMADDPRPIEALKELVLEDLGFSLYQAIDKAKIQLSEDTSATVDFVGKCFDIHQQITRGEFEKVIWDLLDASEKCVNEALVAAGLTPEQIDVVVTTGGSSQIPVFLDMLGSTFGGEKLRSSDAFTSVAAGFALRANEVF